MLAPTLYGAVAIAMYSAFKSQAMPRRLGLTIGKLMDFFVRRDNATTADPIKDRASDTRPYIVRRCCYYDVFSVKAAIVLYRSPPRSAVN